MEYGDGCYAVQCPSIYMNMSMKHTLGASPTIVCMRLSLNNQMKIAQMGGFYYK